MPVVRPSLALIACLAWTSASASAAVALPTVGPQDAPAVLDAQQRTIARFEAYLDHNPFHEGGFERLVESAVAVNGLDDLVERYSTRIEEGDAQRSTRIVLARLYSRTERAGEAIEMLTTIAEEDAAGEAQVDAQLAHLLGRLALDQRLLKDAVRAFDTAAAATTDVRLLERIHADRGAAHLAIGDTQAAVSAFRDLTLLDPQSFHLRLAAAEAMSTNGLFEEALAEYSTAIELAAEMIPRRCRALSESGRLQERLDRPTDALASYDLALDLLGRGHWLKRDLLTRVLALHKRAGSLPNLIRDLRTRVEVDKADLDRRELLARALEETREVADARRVLEEAADDFPDDLPLGRRLLDLLSRAGDVDARIEEYQRQIERHPTELDLYLQLGQTFASEGRLEQARRQWDRTLESRLSDPGLCVRLAGLYALYDMHEQAVRMLERAIDLEPGDLGHFGELASVLVRSNQKQELPALLERARLAAGQNSSRLEVLADLARGLRHTRVARSALEAAIALNPEDPRLLRSLADVCVEEGDLEGAADTLQRILIVAGDDANVRRDAAKRLVRLYQRRGLLRELGRKQEELLEADANAPGAHYVLSRIAAVQHKRTVAVKHLQALLEINPNDVVAATDYAKLQLELGDDAAAIAQYEDLIRVRPALHATYLKEIASIHVNQRREGKALDCYEEILKLSPGNPATFAEVAGRFRALDEHERAAECLRQAVRLRPDDGRYRMELAAVYTELEDAERAQREVLLALRSKEEVVRGRARAWLHERLVEQGAVDEEIARQRERLKVNPYDTEITLTLVDLFVRELEYELALDLIGDLLAYRPDSTPLLRQRAGLQEEMKRWDRARDDYETLLRLPDVDREELQYSLARCALELGDKARADAVLLGAADPLRVAGLYTRFNLHGQATAAIEKALTLVPDDRLLLDRLVRMFEGRGNLDAALEAHARRIDLDGEDWELMQRRSELLVAANRSDELVATTSRMIDTLEVPTEPEGASRLARRRLLRTARSTYRKKLNELRRFYVENGLNAEFAELARARLLAAPADEDLFKLALSAIQWSSMDQGMVVISSGMVAGIPQADGDDGGGPLALETLLAVRRATVDVERLPPGHDARSWNKILDRAEQSLYRRHPVLAAQRTTELDQVGAASLTRVQIDERIDLLAKQGRSKDLVQALKEAVASHPELVEYLAGLGFQLYESRDPLAPTLLAELVEKLEANSSGLRGRRDDDPGAHERHTRRLLKKLPDALREQTDDELTVSLYRLGCNSPLKEGWRVGRTPDALTARLIWGRSLADQGREDEAREVLSVLHPASPEFVSWTSTLAENYQSLGWNAEAARLEQSLFDVVQHVMQHPVLAHKRRWPATVRPRGHGANSSPSGARGAPARGTRAPALLGRAHRSEHAGQPARCG